jgi:hypothetical protein
MSSVTREIITVTYQKTRYTLELIKRPFREGYEAYLTVGERVISLGELGLGKRALRERAKEEIKRILST